MTTCENLTEIVDFFWVMRNDVEDQQAPCDDYENEIENCLVLFGDDYKNKY